MLEGTDWEAAMAEERDKKAEAQRRLFRDDCLRCQVARDDPGISPAVRSLSARWAESSLESRWAPWRLEGDAQRLEERAGQATRNAVTAEGSKTPGEGRADQ